MKTKYTKGLEDVERTFETLDQRYKEDRRKAWLKVNYGKFKHEEDNTDDTKHTGDG